MASDSIWDDPKLPVAVPVPVATPGPSAPPPPPSSSYDPASDPTYREKVSTLRSQGYSTGLAASVVARTNAEFPLRLWVVDNSGSMNADDGRRVVSTRRRTDVRLVRCTRWEEIRECVSYHCHMAALLCAPTNFRLLNDPCGGSQQRFGVAEGGAGSRDAMEGEVRRAEDIMRRAWPRGVTPLTEHVLDIYEQVSGMAPRLKAEGRRVVVVIATDGLPSDDQGHGGRFQSDQFVQALRLLGSLPVWIVIRLCTNDGEVVRFYNDLDDNLELDLEVIDDFPDEAYEVYRHNPWLNYSLPLHRCRELGFHDRLLDLLDERPLTKQELFDFGSLLFGDEAWDDHAPDPDVDWEGFKDRLKQALKKEDRQWNPVTGKVAPLINVRELHRIYGEGFSAEINPKYVILVISILVILWSLT